MKTLRIALVGGLFAAILVGAAYAQVPADLSAGAYGVGAPLRAPHVTPLATIGSLSLGIWTRVPPPYDVTANQNAAANPLP